MRARIVELHTDCSLCRVEQAAIETYDPLEPACRFGVPRSVRCRLCGATHRARLAPGTRAPTGTHLADVPSNACPLCEEHLEPASVDTRSCPSCGAIATLDEERAPDDLGTEAALAAALDRWAAEDGFSSREALIGGTFVLATEAEVLDHLRRGAPIETLADPFALGGARAHAPATRPARPPRPVDPPSDPPPRSAPPRAIVFPLVSVVAADGELHPAERELVDRFLANEGLAPLGDDEFLVHPPHEVARWIPEARREGVIQLMCETAAIDGFPDESELRVIRAFAAAWHIPDEKVDFWIWGYESVHTAGARQLWNKLRRFVLSARWEKPR
jgi:hypothetical protein